MSAAMPAGATPLLEVEHIEVAYGRARAVNGATVRVTEGSITAIVGPNGAGKTSLVQAVSGLQPIRAGSIRFRGVRIDSWPSASRRPGIAPSPRAAASSPR
jgi:ABC-type branched-subunit amino acid transport system ATPase component